MPTNTTDSYVPIVHADLVKGVQATTAHLVTPGKWYDSLNMRFRQGRAYQIPFLINYFQLSARDGYDCQAIVNVLVSDTASSLFAFTSIHLYQITTGATPTATQVDGGVGFLNSNSWDRWAYFVNQSGLYFVNPSNTVKWYNFTSIVDLIDITTTSPNHVGGTKWKAAYIENFASHLVLADVNDGTGNFYPQRIVWSDVNDFTQFTPLVTNEADFFDLDNVVDNSPLGLRITGLKVLNGVCMVYTSNSIYQMQYVGIDAGVMQINRTVANVGNMFPYGLAAIDKQHFFIGEDDFYVYNGAWVQSLGKDVFERFLLDLHPLQAYRNRTWVFIDKFNTEIQWHYCSASSTGPTDKVVIFNYKEGSFYFIESRGCACGFKSTIQTYTSIAQLTGTISALSGSIMNLNTGTTANFNLFGVGNATIVREEIPSDALSSLRPQSDPFLVSPDYFYNDLQGVKEVSSLYVDASWTVATGVAVTLSARKYLSEDVKWVTAGTWTPSLPEGRLSFPRQAGRVFRYQFTGQAARNLQFYAFAENVYNAMTEK